MLLPLKDHNPTRSFPVVTVALIAINVLVFLAQLMDRRLTLTYTMIPAEVVGLAQKNFEAVSPQISILTSTFLHGGWLHLISNMWSLWIFGNNVEDSLGRVRYLILYLIWGYMAGWTHILFNWDSIVPTVGASGAIAGVMGAYLVLFPGARLDCLVVYFILTYVDVPAILFLGIWFITQFFAWNPGVAYMAHIGGFVGGMLLVQMMGGRRRILGARAYEYEEW